jgi:hypothetical protein
MGYMKKFIETDEYGSLYIDRVIFESYYPIIFTCENGVKDLFIVVCCQNNESGCKWLMGKTRGESVVRMLKDELTVRQLLKEHSTGEMTIDYIDGKYTLSRGGSEWSENSAYLPKENSYICAENGEFDEEIKYFSSYDESSRMVKEAFQFMDELLEEIKIEMDNLEDSLLNECCDFYRNPATDNVVINATDNVGNVSVKWNRSPDEIISEEYYETIYSGVDISCGVMSVNLNSDDNKIAYAA